MPSVGISSNVDFGPEGHLREQRELVRRIDSVDVEGRIRLGVAELLRALEHDAEVLAVFAPSR